MGYRVVHPGAHLRGHQRLTAEVLAELRAACEFAPLHDPEALEMIGEMMRRFADVPHIACFDTVFHETMPEEATVYALPYAVRRQGVRRYGFHGLSCESVVAQLREAQGIAFPRRLVIAHLGSGCSVTACIDGKSVDTTMGLTPTGGVMMGTRTGDLDPGVVLFLMRQAGATADSVERMIDGDAGLKALGGVNDMRELRRRAAAGDARARLAIRVFCRTRGEGDCGIHRTAWGGCDCVYRGDWRARRSLRAGRLRAGCAGLAWSWTRRRTRWSLQTAGQSVRKISDEDSPIAVYVVPAEEDRMIARHVARMCRAAR